MPKADINFEKELWDAANELRGAVSENNYKNYILPLVFLKHLSERHDVVKEELQAQLNDPKSDRYTIDTDEIHYVLEDADEYRAKNAFVIPTAASWQYLKDNAEQDNIKVELLRRIINDEIKVRMRKNIQRMTNLKAELEKTLSKYHQNSLDSIAAIKHLLELAEELRQDDIRTKQLGLTEDELAFYDLLSANSSILNEQGPIQDLVHRVVDSLKKNLELDWTKKGNAKAAIRLAVKKELKGKVPFSELDRILKEVIEQAEGQYKDWPMAG